MAADCEFTSTLARVCDKRSIHGQVGEDPEEEGKLGYTNLKRAVWHEAFIKLLDEVIQYSKTGYAYISPYDKIMRWLFPVILILSADYEEQ